MKGFFGCLIGALLAAVLTVGCERRPLLYDYRPYCNVEVKVDWSDFGDTPTGMTVIFYPENGDQPIVHTTTETTETNVGLEAGNYNVLLFNQSPDEFGTLEFKGMEAYETAEVCARETVSKWYSAASEEQKAVREPERLGVARIEGLRISKDMVEKSIQRPTSGEYGEQASISLRPKCVVSTARVRIRVHGLHNVRSARGSMSGMADGYSLSGDSPTSGKASHIIEEWTRELDAADYRRGFLTADFSTFGVAASQVRAAGANHLVLSLLLVDNKTVKDYGFDVSDRIQVDDGGLMLIVEVGTQIGDKDHPADQPIEIEDVKPADGQEGGFDAKVEGWDDEKNVEVPL